MNPLQALQEVIEAMHELMSVLPDPQDTQIVAQCLQNLTRVQAKMMQGQGQAQGPQGQGPDPRQALMAQLGGQ
jgi:hypothetical protein